MRRLLQPRHRMKSALDSQSRGVRASCGPVCVHTRFSAYALVHKPSGLFRPITGDLICHPRATSLTGARCFRTRPSRAGRSSQRLVSGTGAGLSRDAGEGASGG